ncbi:MAG: UvrD-helicase domain-containing protein [Clostridia bacterium]|nr:UvrD-helicase domain-containing protein [Clostridia bacterium]
MDIKSELNEEQFKAAVDTEGAVLVTAGAGSGKTRLLTYRIAYLIENLNVSPFSILAITFTNKAAYEMKDRLKSLVENSGDIWVSTFHSMCVQFLRRFAIKIGFTPDFTIYDTEDSERALKQICKELGIKDDKFYKMAQNIISDAKNKGLNADEWNKSSEFYGSKIDEYRVFSRYEEYLKENNAMDFDDLLLNALNLLLTCREALNYYQQKFKYILVDEFQDTNRIQYNLVRLLSLFHGNVFAVGDEDQSIYSWRGADFTNMQRFIEDYNARVYKLEQNYRSTKNILNAANNVIKNNTTRIEKVLWSNNERGDSLTLYEASSAEDEADYVARNIRRLNMMGKKYSDFAVLMRVNALSRSIEQRFALYGVPYKIHGGFRFFDRKEVKDIIAYLNVIINHYDEISIKRIINFPKRNIGDSSVAQAKNYALLYGQTLYDVIMSVKDNDDLPRSVSKKLAVFADLISELEEDSKTMPLSKFVLSIVKKTGMEALYSDNSEEGQSKLMNIGAFVGYASEFESKYGNNISNFLQEIALYSEGDDANDSAVFLSTVHAAKGMEFDTVFVIGLEEGIFPFSRSSYDAHELEEERRLMYVAITRAKRRLYLTHSSFRALFGNASVYIQSRFLNEIDVGKKPQKRDDFEEKAIAETSTYMNQVRMNSPFASNNAPAKTTAARYEFTSGMRINHKKFGNGTIKSIVETNGRRNASILFDNGMEMLFSLDFAPITPIEDDF